MRRGIAWTACALALCGAAAASASAIGQGVAWVPAGKRTVPSRSCSAQPTRRARNRCRQARHCASRRWRARHKARAKRCPKRRTTKSPATLLLPAPGALDPPSGGTPGGTPGEPVRSVQVQAKEFYFTLSRPLVTAGSVKVQLVNGGEDPHDLHLRREDGSGAQYAFGSTPSQANQTRALDLAPGYYYLWCDLSGHEAAGMHARLRVE